MAGVPENPVCQASMPWMLVGEDMGTYLEPGYPQPYSFPSCCWAMGSGLQRLDLDPEAKACNASACGALG